MSLSRTFYGTTRQGGTYNLGTVFSIPVTGGAPTTLESFNYINGESPIAELTLSGDTLFGTTYSGGADGFGTVFSLTIPEPASLSVLAFAGLAIRRRR